MKTRVFGLAKEGLQEHKIIMLTTFMTVQPGKTNVVRSSARKDVRYFLVFSSLILIPKICIAITF